MNTTVAKLPKLPVVALKRKVAVIDISNSLSHAEVRQSFGSCRYEECHCVNNIPDLGKTILCLLPLDGVLAGRAESKNFASHVLRVVPSTEV